MTDTLTDMAARSPDAATRAAPVPRETTLAVRTTGAVATVVLPVLLTALMLRYFVPTPAEAAGTWAAPLANAFDGHFVALTFSVFLCFTLMANHWFAWFVPETTQQARRGSRWGLWVAIGLGGAALIGIRATSGVYRVESASMLPTLEPLDLLAGNRRGSWFRPKEPILPARGDLVVFKKPAGVEGPDLLVKRVVGLPGDHISMKGAVPIINGRMVRVCEVGPYVYPLPEGGAAAGRAFVEFLGDRPHLAMYAPIGGAWEKSYDVKPGEVFVLGDNRNNSSDSRAWNYENGAGLPIESIEARVTRWLIGLDRSLHLDFAHAEHPLELTVRLSGLDTSYLRDNIKHCLEKPPEDPPHEP